MRKINFKNWLVIVCSIVLFGIFIFYWQSSCKLYDKNSVLKGQAIELAKQLDNQKQLLIESKKNNITLQSEMDEIVAEAEGAISEVAETNTALNRHIGQLREARTKLTDSEAIILNQDEQIKVQDKIILNLEFTISKKDEQIFALTEKYVSEKSLRIETEGVLLTCSKVLQINDLRIKGLEKRLRKTRFLSNVKTGVVVGLVATVVYGLVK